MRTGRVPGILHKLNIGVLENTQLVEAIIGQGAVFIGVGSSGGNKNSIRQGLCPVFSLIETIEVILTDAGGIGNRAVPVFVGVIRKNIDLTDGPHLIRNPGIDTLHICGTILNDQAGIYPGIRLYSIRLKSDVAMLEIIKPVVSEQ